MLCHLQHQTFSWWGIIGYPQPMLHVTCVVYCRGDVKISWMMVSLDTWWRHQMETFSALLALCAGNSPVPVNSPHRGQWRRALMFSLICARINDLVNNREAGDLRRHRGHYDANVMRYSEWGISHYSRYENYCIYTLSCLFKSTCESKLK